jgi:hypothetical protein
LAKGPIRGALKAWWLRIWRRPQPPAALPAPAEQPQTLGSESEVFLSQLATDLGDGKRRSELAEPTVLAKLDDLWESGQERLAIEWMEKLLRVPGISSDKTPTLRARLVERYEQRGELSCALDHLRELTGDEPHALRAHYLLAEHARRIEDYELALRHYEAVLGRDVDYPNVRARVERIRQLTGRAAPNAGETMAAGEIGGVQAGTRYRLLRELGRGASGVVYLANDTELGRNVAIKLLHPHLGGSEPSGALARFFHEARIMASLRHPNVVAVLDLDERSRRIVMELAAGGTLRDVLRDRGPRPLRRAIERHGQIMSALAAAHRRGIVHCDLKPGNLLFRRDADHAGVEMMLGDFGAAHLPSPRSSQAASEGPVHRAQALGTLAYMAPEQRRGDVSPACDLYASAVVLYEMLTGHTPWSREALIAGSRHPDDFQLPTQIFENARQLGQDLQAYLDWLSAPDPTHRPTTAQSLAESQRLRARAIASGIA